MEMFYSLAVSMSGFWLQYCSRIWRDVTIGVHGSLCILFLATICKSTIILKNELEKTMSLKFCHFAIVLTLNYLLLLFKIVNARQSLF